MVMRIWIMMKTEDGTECDDNFDEDIQNAED